MGGRSIAERGLRGAARVAAWCYPPAFRREHRLAFPDVVAHIFARERAHRSTWRAAWTALRYLSADTAVGAPGAWREAARALRWPHAGLSGAGRDAALAVRAAVRRPAFPLLIAGTLGLGIGASTAAFDALDRAILHPFPFARGRELVMIVMRDTRTDGMSSVPLEALHAWRAASHTTTGIEVFRRSTVILNQPTGAQPLEAVSVSGGLPDLIGVRPVAGRLLGPGDAAPSAPAAVMISEQFWHSAYGSDPAVIGRSMALGATSAIVVGVWPQGGRFDFFEPPAVIRPLPAGNEYGRGSWVQIVARVAPGRRSADVEAELRALTPVDPSGGPMDTRTATIVPPSMLLLGQPFVTGVWLVFGAALVLLVTAVVNAGYLILDRSTRRREELGVRLALGASRARLMRLFAAEGTLLAAGGLLAGTAVGAMLEAAIVHVEPRLYRAATGAGLVGRAFAFSAGASVIVAVICAIAPLLRTDRASAATIMGGGHRHTARRSWITGIVTGVQAALAVLLVVGALLMNRSVSKLLAIDTGVDAAHLIEVPVSLPAARYSTPAARTEFWRRAAETLAGAPGTTGVTTSPAPILMSSIVNGHPRFNNEPEPIVPPAALTAGGSVPPSYFSTLGIRVIQGRLYTANEPDTAVVSASAARGRTDVVGAMVYLPGWTKGFRVVGVVSDVRYPGLSSDAYQPPAVYWLPPSGPTTSSYVRYLIRTTVAPAMAIAEAKRRLAALDPLVPVIGAQTGEQVLLDTSAQQRFVAVLLTGLAALGFLLAASGIYGVVALGIARQRRELGVRLALGAPPRRLIGHVLRIRLTPIAAGAGAGVLCAMAAAPRIESLLVRVSAHDPLSLAAGAAVVIATAAVAAWLPSQRILGIDPTVTLREP